MANRNRIVRGFLSTDAIRFAHRILPDSNRAIRRPNCGCSHGCHCWLVQQCFRKDTAGQASSGTLYPAPLSPRDPISRTPPTIHSYHHNLAGQDLTARVLSRDSHASIGTRPSDGPSGLTSAAECLFFTVKSRLHRRARFAPGEVVMATTIQWETELDRGLARARSENKEVLLDFFNPG